MSKSWGVISAHFTGVNYFVQGVDTMVYSGKLCLLRETTYQREVKSMKIQSSPWGSVQSQYELAPGIIKVSTAGHGGIWLSPERQAQLPGWALQVPSSYCSKPMWWEEDCEAQIVMYVFWEEIEQCVGKWPAFLSKEKMAKYLWQCGYPIIPEAA